MRSLSTLLALLCILISIFYARTKSNNGRLYYEGASEPHVLYKANTPMRIAKIESNKDGMQNIVYLEEVDNISLTNNDGSFSPETAKFNDYFGKESRFGFDSKQARDHSTFMDQFSGQATVEQITQIRQKIEAVAQMYADKTGKKLELTDAQIQAIIDTHLLPGQLGKLTQIELMIKNRKLVEVISDVDLRRFLLEAGFCGAWGKLKDHIKIFTNGTINDDEKKGLSNVSNDLVNQYSQYHESVGVYEGYTLLEHTNMVLGQFDKYFGKTFDFGVITKNYFRDLLMIHDIGKPMAHKMGNKDDQHIYTKPLIEEILREKGYTNDLVNFGVEFMTMDPIGGYLQKKCTLDESIDIIKKAYAISGTSLSIEKYFDLLKMYYLVDVSSYTSDANGIPSLDYLFDFDKGLQLNNPLQSKVNIIGDILITDINQNNMRLENILAKALEIEDNDIEGFKRFVDTLNLEEKSKLLTKLSSKILSSSIIMGNDSYKLALTLYIDDYYQNMNSLYIPDMQVRSNPIGNKVGILGDYFLKKGFDNKIFKEYQQNKFLYRDERINENTNYLNSLLSLKEGDAFISPQYFSTTLKAKGGIKSDYWNNDRGKSTEMLKQEAQIAAQNTYDDAESQKKDDFDFGFESISPEEQYKKTLQDINEGKSYNMSHLDNYAVRFIITNSKGGIEINDQGVSGLHHSEEEILFAPGRHWRVQKNSVDHDKKTILLILEGI